MRLLLLLALSLTALLPAVEAVKPAAPKICVLRLEDALKANTEYQAGMESWKKDQEAIGAGLKAIDEKLAELDGKLSVLKMDHPSFGTIQEELEGLKLKKKLTIERARGELERRQVGLVKKVFATVRTRLQGFCQERGIMLVHLAPDGELNSGAFTDLQLELGIKSVLWYDPSMDITEAFIPYMNGVPADAAPAKP